MRIISVVEPVKDQSSSILFLKLWLNSNYDLSLDFTASL